MEKQIEEEWKHIEGEGKNILGKTVRWISHNKWKICEGEINPNEQIYSWKLKN